jgi:hypothetical protein
VNDIQSALGILKSRGNVGTGLAKSSGAIIRAKTPRILLLQFDQAQVSLRLVIIEVIHKNNSFFLRNIHISRNQKNLAAQLGFASVMTKPQI